MYESSFPDAETVGDQVNKITDSTSKTGKLSEILETHGIYISNVFVCFHVNKAFILPVTYWEGRRVKCLTYTHIHQVFTLFCLFDQLSV